MTEVIFALLNEKRFFDRVIYFFRETSEGIQRYDECHKSSLIHKYELGHEWILSLSVG
jgi:hypothetical protein